MAQPMSAAPGQAFGEAKRQLDAQRTMPLPSADTPSLGAPSARPTEPVTAGIDSGPGPGSEIIEQPPDVQAFEMSLARSLPGLRRLASLPGVHPSVKSAARRLSIHTRLQR